MSNLIILTKQYPYSPYEQYLNDELKIISKHFDKIYLYPNDYYDEELQTEVKLPYNVEVLNLNKKISNVKGKFLKDVILLFETVFQEILYSNDRTYLIKNFKWNLIQLWTQIKLSYVLHDFLNNNPGNYIFYSYWFHKSALLLSVLKKRNIIPKFISRAHSVDLYHQQWPIINNDVKVPPFQYFKMKYVDNLFCISDHGEECLRKMYPEFKKKINTSYLGIIVQENTKKFTSSDFVIVTCSGIDFNKRVHVLATILRKTNMSFSWFHFGDGPLLNELQKETSLFKSNQRFYFKGKTAHEAIISFYKNNPVSVFINISITEGVPVSIMEAMSFEIPVIATNVNGVSELVIHEKTGFLIPVNFDENEFLNKISYLIENPERRKEMGKEAKKHILTTFNAEKNYSEFANKLKNYAFSYHIRL